MKSRDLKVNINTFKKILKNDSNAIFREFESSCGRIKCCIVFIDGMVNKELISRHVVYAIQQIGIKSKIEDYDLIESLEKRVIQMDEVEILSNVQDATKKILYGDTFLMVEGCMRGLLIDTKGWANRGVVEPDTERNVRGCKEAFSEPLMLNLSMLRRKILDASVKYESYEAGNKTHTQIMVTYIEGLVSDDLLHKITDRIKKININAILDSQYISDFISDHPGSIFKTVGFSERPDVIAAKLLEGRVAVFCDGSPVVLFAPLLFYEQFVVSEDHYVKYAFAIFNRFLRLLAFIFSTSLPALYIAIVTYNQEILPIELFLSISAARHGVPFPSVVEVFLMLICFDMLREAGARLPKSVGDTVSFVGALILGEAAVSAQIVSAPIIIIAALTGISSLILPKALQGIIFIRYGLLLFSSVLGLPGYLIGVMMFVIYLMGIDSFGTPYMTYLYNPDVRGSQENIFPLPWNKKKNNANNLSHKRNESMDK